VRRAGFAITAAAAGAFVLAFAAAASADEGGQAVAVAAVRFVDGVPARPSVADRLDAIRRRIQEALVYPPLARLDGVEGETLVYFDVGRDGHAVAVAVAASSGVPSLDRAALRAVRRAAPMPWVHGRLAVPVRFSLRGGP